MLRVDFAARRLYITRSVLLLRSFTSQSRFLLFRVFARVQNDIYILKKVCKKYAEGMLKPSLLRQGLAKRA